MVVVVMVLFFPVAAPIAYCLDRVLGEDEGVTTYNKTELATMMRIQQEESARESSKKRAIGSGSTKGGSSKGQSSKGQSSKGGGEVTETDDIEAAEDKDNTHVKEEEVTMIEGMLKFGELVCEDVMNVDIFMLSTAEKLHRQTFYKIFKAGYSRVPVYDKSRDNIIGLITVKDFLCLDPEDEVCSPARVGSVQRTAYCLLESWSCAHCFHMHWME
jgi:hypothetical protein